MIILIKIAFLFSVTFSTPQDYNYCRWMLSENCKIESIDEACAIGVKQDGIKIDNSVYIWGEVIIVDEYKRIRLRKAFREICILMELADENDSTWIFNNVADFREKNKFYHEYPNPNKFNFFITYAETKKLVKFNEAYRRFIKNRIDTHLEQDREDKLTEVLSEINEMNCFWEAMEKILLKTSSGQHCFETRKKALIFVHDYLGKEKFYKGIYPPNIPYWRFIEE